MLFSRALIKTLFFVFIATSGLCAGNPIYLYSENQQPEIVYNGKSQNSPQSNAATSSENKMQTTTPSREKPAEDLIFISNEKEQSPKPAAKSPVTNNSLTPPQQATPATEAPLAPQKERPAPTLEDEKKTEKDTEALITATSTPLWEGTIPKTEVNPYMEESKPFEHMLSIFSTLILIIMLMFGISWLLQKKGFLSKNNYGKVLSILPLDNKRLIYIVDIMGKIYLLGVTEYNVNLIGQITDPTALKLLKLENSDKQGFDENLAKAEVETIGGAGQQKPNPTLVEGIKQAMEFQKLKDLDK
jgi:flagellar biogenesis protein FliO